MRGFELASVLHAPPVPEQCKEQHREVPYRCLWSVPFPLHHVRLLWFHTHVSEGIFFGGVTELVQRHCAILLITCAHFFSPQHHAKFRRVQDFCCGVLCCFYFFY